MDIGHHFDLQRSVLGDLGFSAVAIRVTQVSSWLTDYYSYSPTSPSSVSSVLENLHFDNLFSTDAIASYWKHFTKNAHDQFRQHAAGADPRTCLILLGMTSHTIQDFYAHSNWVELHPRADGARLRSDDWFSHTGPLPAGMVTGAFPASDNHEEHGDYNDGLNKDSYVRPRWLDAYAFAYCSTHHWTETVRNWIEDENPGFWNTIKTYAVGGSEREKIDFDAKAAFGISMWIEGSGKDGLWKGNGSGDRSLFTDIASRWTSATDSPIVRAIKTDHVAHPLAANLYSGTNPASVPVLLQSPHIRRAVVVVRTLRVRDEQPWYDPIDIGSAADFYARINVAGQEFVESVQQNRSSPRPKWTTVVFVQNDGPRLVPIRYRIIDEDDLINGGDDVCDVNPEDGKSELSLNLNLDTGRLSGDISGQHDSSSRAFAVRGDGDDDEVSVRAYIAKMDLV